MADKHLGIIMNGATSRICRTQHLENALVPIRDEGGLQIGEHRIIPRPLLVGRDPVRVEAVARTYGIDDWTTDLDAALTDSAFPILFDAAVTHQRVATLERAIEAGRHIYSEKPVAPSSTEGLRLLNAAEAGGLKHGAVEDKHFMPGLVKLDHLVGSGFFGAIRSFKLEFGWWVFDGQDVPCQRPSWNYRSEGGGGMVLDMHPHWRYVVENILGPIASVVAATWTATPERIDENGQSYAVDVEDSVVTLLELESGVCGTIHSSWATRVRRDELLAFQVDGTLGSAVAGLHHCHVQSISETPQMQWSPNQDLQPDYRADWGEAPDLLDCGNSYRMGWEGFLRHVVADEPFAATLAGGIRDVRLAEACLTSARERRWVAMDEVVEC